MREYYTDALVLGSRASGEADRFITLFTERLGKIRVKARSSRKPTSKMAGHLEPLTFLSCRIIEKHGFQIADPLSSTKISMDKESMNFLAFMDEMLVELDPDEEIWKFVKVAAASLPEKRPDYRAFLKILGFDPSFGRCRGCENAEVAFFSKNGHFFLCSICGANSLINHYDAERDLWALD